MNPIQIDLRDLTQAHVDQALPNLKGCRYANPCIIGTLVPKEHRQTLDKANPNYPDDSADVGDLIDRGIITLPEDQIEDAKALQEHFDLGREKEFLALVQPWVEAQPC